MAYAQKGNELHVYKNVRYEEVKTSSALRLRGKNLYKAARYEEALSCYSQALVCDDVTQADKAKLHNNRAACFLKLSKFTDVVIETDECEFVIFSFSFDH